MTAIIGADFEIPFWPGGTGSTPSVFALNESTDAVEFVFQAPEAATIAEVFCRQGMVTGTAPTFKASLQGVDTTGIPDGVILGGGSPASGLFTPVGANNNVGIWIPLDNPISVVRGQWLSLVIKHDSGTIDGSNNCSFTTASNISTVPGTAYPITNNAGSRIRTQLCAIYAYKTSGGRAFGTPASTITVTGFNSGSSPDERANLINIPTSWCATYTIKGLAVYCSLTSTTIDLILYDSDGSTILQSLEVDADIDQNPTTNKRRVYYFDETNLAVLQAGTPYRLAFKPRTSTVTLYSFTVLSSSDMSAFLGESSICKGSFRTDGGAWTNSDLLRHAINPILGDITTPSAGSGVSAGRLFGGL